MKIVIAAYAAKLATDKVNPKNYPMWGEVVRLLNEAGHEVTQIGCDGEARIHGVAHFLLNWPLERLKWLIENSDLWISVDSFLPHLCATEGLKTGIVLWGVSDDRIWGYPHNINLVKDYKYLRKWQFAHWKDEWYDAEAFVAPEAVIEAVNERLQTQAARS